MSEGSFPPRKIQSVVRLLHGYRPQRGPSTQPLGEQSDLAVRAWVRAHVFDPDPGVREWARVTAAFVFLGIHPAVLAEPERYNLRVDGRYVRWNRTKTLEPITFPMVPELAGWFPQWLNERRPWSRCTLWRYVKRVGEICGVPELCPRVERHTMAARLVERTGFNTAKALTGTTDKVLINYARRAALRSDLERIAEEGI